MTLLCAASPGAWAAGGTPADSTGEWVLQLGYFANADNALALQQRVVDAGFEARTVTASQGGEPRYRVVSGQAGSRAGLAELRSSVEQRLGIKGFAQNDPTATVRAQTVVGGVAYDPAAASIVESASVAASTVVAESAPVDESASESEFEPNAEPKPSALLAQAGRAQPLDPSPMATAGYDAGLSRTPQEAIPSSAGFTLGGLQIVPTLGLSLGYDDNITRARSDAVAPVVGAPPPANSPANPSADRGAISSWFYKVSPAIRAELPTNRSVLTLTAAADMVRFEDSPVDDRDHFSLRGDWAWDVSDRQDVNLFAQYVEGADARGEGRRQGDAGLIPLEPDEWERREFGGGWDYGAVGARGRLSLRAAWAELDYTNNRDGFVPGDVGTTALERDWWTAGGTFYWRVAPKTSLLADYQYTDMNYNEASTAGFDAFGADSEIHTWMLGVTWDATARTSGRLSYGNQKRTFADPTVEDYSGPAWAASASWHPRTYSAFTLTGTRSTQEPDGNGDYVLRQDITLSWLHDWATRFGTMVDIGYGEDDYRPRGRTDDLFYWGAGLRYTFNPHFRFGLSVNSYDRDSPLAEFRYRRTVYLLTLEASF